MKVVYFTKYNRNGASSRLRSYQFVPLLEKEGIDVTIFPFFDEDYLHSLYAKKSISKIKLLGFYWNRFIKLFSIYKFDKIIIEKELFPYFFSWFEKLLWLFNVKYIVDYDDAIFHNYDLSKNKLVKFLLKNKIYNVMKYSNHVLAGNEYLAQKAKNSSAKKIIIHPTVIDVDAYKVKDNYTTSKVVIGWIGSPTTYKYIKNLESVFIKLSNLYTIEFHIIGAKNNEVKLDNVKFIDWSEENEVALISKFDIGIMPLENTPWELGKCSYKLIQYMGCGIPVVASSVGMNKEVIEEGKNGFLVSDEQQWIEKLSVLIENEVLRENLGKQGRLKVEDLFSNKKTVQKLLSILRDEY